MNQTVYLLLGFAFLCLGVRGGEIQVEECLDDELLIEEASPEVRNVRGWFTVEDDPPLKQIVETSSLFTGCQVQQLDAATATVSEIKMKVASRIPFLLKNVPEFTKLSNKWSNQSYFSSQYGHHSISLQNQQSMSAIPSKKGYAKVTINDYLSINSDVFIRYRDSAIYPQVATALPLEDSPLSPLIRQLRDEGVQPPDLLRHMKLETNLLSLSPSRRGRSFTYRETEWQGLLTGRKLWFFYSKNRVPRREMYHRVALTATWKFVQPLPERRLVTGRKAIKLDFDSLPKDTRPVHCMQEPGDVMFVPAYTWRADFAVGDTVSVGGKNFERGVGKQQHSSTGVGMMELLEDGGASSKKRVERHEIPKKLKNIFTKEGYSSFLLPQAVDLYMKPERKQPLSAIERLLETIHQNVQMAYSKIGSIERADLQHWYEDVANILIPQYMLDADVVKGSKFARERCEAMSLEFLSMAKNLNKTMNQLGGADVSEVFKEEERVDYYEE